MYLNLAPVAATQGDGGEGGKLHQTNADDTTYLFVDCLLFFPFGRLIEQQQRERDWVRLASNLLSFSWAELYPDRFLFAYPLRILHFLASVRAGSSK